MAAVPSLERQSNPVSIGGRQEVRQKERAVSLWPVSGLERQVLASRTPQACMRQALLGVHELEERFVTLAHQPKDGSNIPVVTQKPYLAAGMVVDQGPRRVPPHHYSPEDLPGSRCHPLGKLFTVGRTVVGTPSFDLASDEAVRDSVCPREDFLLPTYRPRIFR